MDVGNSYISLPKSNTTSPNIHPFHMSLHSKYVISRFNRPSNLAVSQIWRDWVFCTRSCLMYRPCAAWLEPDGYWRRIALCWLGWVVTEWSLEVMSSCRVVKQTRLKDLQTKNYQGSNDEWIKTVSLILGQCSAPPDEPDWATGLEASASISGSDEDNKEIVITIRKRVQNITVSVPYQRGICIYMSLLTLI